MENLTFKEFKQQLEEFDQCLEDKVVIDEAALAHDLLYKIGSGIAKHFPHQPQHKLVFQILLHYMIKEIIYQNIVYYKIDLDDEEKLTTLIKDIQIPWDYSIREGINMARYERGKQQVGSIYPQVLDEIIESFKKET